MLKKLAVIVAILSGVVGVQLVESNPQIQLVETSHAYAATAVYAPQSVGTYNDFGEEIRLDINPKYTNASKYKIEWAPGYNVTSGFQSEVISADTNYRTSSYQYVTRTWLSATSLGWWTVRIWSIASDGTVSATPWTGNVNVLH